MATTVGQHSVAAFTSPVNGTTPIDANTVRGNDNTVRVAYVDHDADPGIHVQSSTLASRPAAGTAGRKWINSDYPQKLWYDDGTDWHEVGGDSINVYCKATETIAKGDVVKVTGYNTGQDVPEIAKVASASDVAFGIAETAIANGSLGYVINTGIIQGVATNSFSLGNILYPNTSGGLTATKPTSGNYQPVAYVLRSNLNNGVLYVEFSAPRIVEASANTASTVVQRDASGNFAAGTITAGALTASGAVSAGSVTSTGLVTFASLKGTGATTVTNILDEDNMASDSATALATQQSIKAYVDAKVATVDTLAEVLANGNTTGAHDIIVNAGQKIRTPVIASQNNATAITIADTTGALTLATALADSNLATISTAGKVSNSATTATSANTASAIVARDASGNFSAGTITAALTGNASTATALQTARTINGTSFDGTANITVTAAAGTLTGTTLASNVVSSSLTSVGTLTSLTMTGDLTAGTNQLKLAASTGNLGIGTATPGYKLDVVGSANVSSGNTYKVNGTDVLSATTLGSGVTASSLTSVGTLSSLTVSGDLTVDTSTLKVDSANNSVGIGTATPGTTYQLTVRRDGADTGLRIGNNTTYDQFIYFNGNNDWSIGMDYSNSNAFVISNASTLGTNDRVVLTTSGNLGLGVTPSAWGTNRVALQVGASGKFSEFIGSGNGVGFGHNYFWDGTSYKYINTDVAARFSFDYDATGGFAWLTAASGTAGNAITFTQAMTLDASGNLGVGGTPDTKLYVNGNARIAKFVASTGTSNVYAAFTNTGGSSYIGNDNSAGNGMFVTGGAAYALSILTESSYPIVFGTNNTERARITSGGDFLVGKTTDDNTTAGSTLSPNGYGRFVRNGELLLLNRLSTDGDLILFRQDGTDEGSISVSGNTVSYNAFAGSHWSQLEDGSKPEILRGTVMEALNELCEWPGEQNERLPKAKVSDTAASKKVYGVFMAWDNDWTVTNDMYVTAVGAFICRVAADVVVEQGDLLESNGDGTARVQADDVIRSSTIGKVTSTVKTHEYEDGTYCVPTVLYCG